MSLLQQLIDRVSSGSRPAGRIADTVAPASSEQYEWDVDQDSILESVRVRFYANQQLALRVDPYLIVDDGRREIVRYQSNGKQYLDGDDDVFEYDVSIAVPEGSTIVVDAENTNSDYEYDFSVDFSLEEGSIE